MNSYFFSTEKLPDPLSPIQFKQYLKEYREGNMEAKKILIEHNIRLVLNYVGVYFKTTNYDQKELVSVGYIGLIKAVETFDITKNTKFSSYAQICIQNEILMFIRKMKKHMYNVVESELINSDSTTLCDLLFDKKVHFEDDYEKKKQIERILDIVKTLPERQQNILRWYYENQYTEKQIAKHLKISRSLVSRLKLEALKKIREQLIEEKWIEPTSKKKHKTRKQ